MREEAGGRAKKQVVDIWAIITHPPPPKKIRNRDEAEWGFALALACTSNCLYPAIGSAFPRKTPTRNCKYNTLSWNWNLRLLANAVPT